MKSFVGVLAVLLVPVFPAAYAQTSGSPSELFLDLQLTPGSVLVSRLPQNDLPLGAHFVFNFADLSIEKNAVQGAFAQPHIVNASLRWNGLDPPGWSLNPATPSPSPSTTFAGTSGYGEFDVFHSPSSTQKSVSGVLSVRLTNYATKEFVEREAPFTVIVAPSPAASIKVIPPAKDVVKPDELVTLRLQLQNLDSYPSTYRITAEALSAEGVDPSKLAFGGTGDRYLDENERRDALISFKAPREVFWYNSVPLLVQFSVTDPAGGKTTTFANLVIKGFYVAENLYILLIAAIAQVCLLIWLILFARRRYEGRYLGRPIPPWRIPQEASRLERIKRDDPKAHYVTRYFLMEEEYRSALLWFYAYKKISKKRLKAEIKAIEMREKADQLVSMPSERFDRASGRIQRRYARRMERAEAAAQRRIERLQAKLERNYEKDYEKDHEKWETKVEKLQKKHNKPYLKAKAKWDKETKKVLEAWEKPFRKDKKKHEEALAKAKEAYAKKVKKADKDTWRTWREQMDDWEQENKIRRKEGRDLAPEPALFSAAVGPPELPAPFQEPPKPELPPEPRPETNVELPPEPKLTTPELMTSHYAKKAKKIRRQGQKDVRKLELQMAEKLNKLRHKREASGVEVQEKREKLLAESQVVTTQAGGFVDRVLRRSQEDIDRRHHVAYLRGLTKERTKELEEAEEAQIERVRIQGERAQADLESKILRERAGTRRGSATPPEKAERIASLVRRLGELKLENQTRLEAAKRESKERLEAAVAKLKADEKAQIEREQSRKEPTPAAEPSQS